MIITLLDSDGRGQLFQRGEVVSTIDDEDIDLQATLMTGADNFLITYTRHSITLRDISTLASVLQITPG